MMKGIAGLFQGFLHPDLEKTREGDPEIPAYDMGPFPVVISQLADTLHQDKAHDTPASKAKGEVTADDDGES